MKPEVLRRSPEASPLQRDASLVSETATARAPAGKFISGERARRYIALVLGGVIGVAVLTVGLAFYNHATPRPAHWLDGSWVAILSPQAFVTNAFCNHPDPRCRNLAISGVTGDGQYRAMWGDQGGQPSTAEITLIGKTVRIQTSFNVLADVTRNDGDILSGSLGGPNGWSIPITLRRVEDLTWGTRALNHWLNGAWVAILSVEQISESDFCSHSDPRCREFFVSGIGGNGSYGGLWGYQDGKMGQADITVSGDTVEIVSATYSHIELQRNADGTVSGTLTTPEGKLFLVKLRQVERASD